MNNRHYSNRPPDDHSRARYWAEHPYGKLLERLAVGMLSFFAVWQFTMINELDDDVSFMRGNIQSLDVRITRAEQDIQALIGQYESIRELGKSDKE